MVEQLDQRRVRPDIEVLSDVDLRHAVERLADLDVEVPMGGGTDESGVSVVWQESGIEEPADLDGGGFVFRSVDEHGPTYSRRLLWLEDSDQGCVSHLWLFLTPYAAGSLVQPGYVHDMITRVQFRNQGYLRQLVQWARTGQPEDRWPYCVDRALTSDGGPVAVRLGLIAPEQYRHGRSDRKTYRALRGCDHLDHNGASEAVRHQARGRAPSARLRVRNT